MLQVVGITKYEGDAYGWVVWDDYMKLPSFITHMELSDFLNSTADFFNVELVAGTVNLLDVNYTDLPVYDIFGKYLGSSPVFYVLGIKDNKYLLLTNSFSIEAVEADKIKALLKRNPKFICNCSLVDDKITIKQPIKTNKVADTKPVINLMNERLMTSGMVLFGNPVAAAHCISSTVSVTVNNQTAINVLNSLGDLFIDDNGIGAWAYKEFGITLVMQVSSSTVLISKVSIYGSERHLGDFEESHEKNFHKSAIEHISDIDYNIVISELMLKRGYGYYTIEELQSELYSLIAIIAQNVVRVGTSDVLGPIDVQQTLDNFNKEPLLKALREKGFLRKYHL